MAPTLSPKTDSPRRNRDPQGVRSWLSRWSKGGARNSYGRRAMDKPRNTLPTHVDLATAMCHSLSLEDHSAMAPDLGPGDYGAGWVTRESAIRLAEQLLLDAQALPAESLKRTRRMAHDQGYEAGWRACRRIYGPIFQGLRRCGIRR